MNVSFPYGTSKMEVHVPDEWQIVSIATPKEVAGTTDEIAEIESALNNPIGVASIDKLTKGKKSAVILVDDYSRPTRAEKVLMSILKKLNSAGIEDSNITVVVAKGTRERPMTRQELERKIGLEAVERLTVVNHNCKEDLVYLGVNKSGNNVSINRMVAEADLKIGMGRIVPHEMAGYSGGAKIILPGVSGGQTVAHNHLLMSKLKDITTLFGNNDGNILREDMEEAAKKSKLDMVIDQVTNRKNELVKVVAGDFVGAHRAGSALSKNIFGVKIPERADVVIISNEERGTMVAESLCAIPALKLVKKSGVIIIVAPCNEGFGYNHFERLVENDNLDECLQEIRDKGWGGAGLAYIYLKWIKQYNPILVSELKQKDVERVGIVATNSVREALEEAKSRLGGYGKVTLAPYGVSFLPIMAT